MTELADLRERIDALDAEILRLLSERANLALEVGRIKNRDGLPIYAPEREEAVLRRLVEKNPGPLPEVAIRAIYREIMSAALALENDIVIACHGPEGGMTHMAARHRFGMSVTYAFFPEIAGVLDCVAASQADCGVVPLEDEEHGTLSQTLDHLTGTSLVICAEIHSSVATNSEGVSRFLVLGRQPTPVSGDDRTTLLIRLEDKPGALVTALEPFRDTGMNISHIASRPAAKGSRDVFFFFEVDGHSRDEHFSELLRELSRRCRAVKVLGSYPKC